MIHETLLQAIRVRLSAALAAPRDKYVALCVQGCAVAWLDERRAARLLQFDRTFVRDGNALAFAPELVDAPSRTDALGKIARALSAEGALTAWRDEAYSVSTSFGGAPLFHLERAAARYFGIVTYAAHLNGIVLCDGEPRMWLARRSLTKAIDPGQLDNLVGGGIRAGTTVEETVRREAWEEAGITAALAGNARAANAVRVCRAQPDGLQREVIHVHDLVLPTDFTPHGVDDEVVEHRLVRLPEAARLIANHEGPDLVTADASLVVTDYLLRNGWFSPDSEHYLPLAALRWPWLTPHCREGETPPAGNA